jgi:ribosome-associated heat shock protein Hsp15
MGMPQANQDGIPVPGVHTVVNIRVANTVPIVRHASASVASVIAKGRVRHASTGGKSGARKRPIQIRPLPSSLRLRRSSKPMPKSAVKETPAAELERQRIDRWLWHARVVRTRGAAAALASAGYVRVNGARIDAPGRTVRPGDVVTVALDRTVRVLRVTGFAARRGAAAGSDGLYEDLG